MQIKARATLLIAGCLSAAAGCAQYPPSGSRPMVFSPPPAPPVRAATQVAANAVQPAAANTPLPTTIGPPPRATASGYGENGANRAGTGESVVRAQSKDTGDGPLPIEAPKSGGLKSFMRRATSIARPSESEEAARAMFKEGDTLFEEKKYAEAQVKYQAAGNRYPDSFLEEDALFMVAECQFFQDNYPGASDTYGQILKRNSNTRHLDRITRRLFAIGEYWKERYNESPTWSLKPNFTDDTRPFFDTKGNSVSSFRAVWMNDPTGPLADDSIMQVANTYFLHGDWINADTHYTQLRRDHPSSKHVMQAYLLGFRTKLELYQGPGYDRTPLNEAEDLIETLMLQFANDLGEERERVIQARAAVRAQQAERDWDMASYYVNGGHNRAARKVLDKLATKYPESKFAEDARQQLAALEGQPDHPKEHLIWLANIFPKPKQLPQPINAKHRSELR